MTDPVARDRPLDGRTVHRCADCGLRGQYGPSLDLDAIRQEVVEGVEEGDRSDDHDLGPDSIGDMVYEILRVAIRDITPGHLGAKHANLPYPSSGLTAYLDREFARSAPPPAAPGLREALRTAIRHWEERSNEGRDYGEWIAVSDDPEAVLYRAVRDALRTAALAETPGEPQ
jgi:hypothetical protein